VVSICEAPKLATSVVAAGAWMSKSGAISLVASGGES
jgi:hypothetical protein